MFKYILFLTSVALLTSCASRKKYVYFQGESETTDYKNHYSPTIKADDLLRIVVTSANPEADIPFNMSLPTQGAGTLMQGGPLGYLVTEDGFISLPYIGKTMVMGKSRQDLVIELQKILKDYLTLPVVQVQILNFKVTILGDVGNPGMYTIQNERLTLIEAIGLAGDLKITGKRKNVKVIREKDGKRIEYFVNLTDKQIFSSPVYYIQQNDVIYVEPNQTSLVQAVISPAYSFIFSVTAVLVTTITTFGK